ncbi:MAG: N(4)-(beta-N-acetylglucosaminyl)-L-asparaginase [Verrucomicrobia bacterium]|nr:N(4)-(beta-N-acetylglucosaminyl)-L-asparaginase [Verrucomicrobiota bacterium]
MTRRTFLTAAGASVTAGLTQQGFPQKAPGNPLPRPSATQGRPLIVSTWPFGKPANERAREMYAQTGNGLDAIEAGIRLTESDISNASVGIGGIPNAQGVVQLDACIMAGPGHRAGSVAGIEDILHPISAARLVMEKTPHVMLVGDGARKFALEQGLESGDLLTPNQKQRWMEWVAAQRRTYQPEKPEDNHDTIAMVLMDEKGDLYGGCSTSGWGYKLPGRVGDSPIIGGGLYVDNEIGAAGATGLGENVMRYCGSFLVVEFMRQGMHPEEACVETIRRIAKLDPRPIHDLAINFLAINKKGEYGAAGSSSGFQYAITLPDQSRVLKSAALSNVNEIPLGGNRLTDDI